MISTFASIRPKSSVECNKVVSDIFGKFEFLMKYQNMGLYVHFAPFFKVVILFFFRNIKKKRCKKRRKCKKKRVPVA